MAHSEAAKLIGRFENTIPSQLAVAQSGSALHLECKGRQFESDRRDIKEILWELIILHRLSLV